MKLNDNEILIGEVANHAGCLVIKNEGGKFYWGMIEGLDVGDYWNEISETLYNEILKQNDSEFIG